MKKPVVALSALAAASLLVTAGIAGLSLARSPAAIAACTPSGNRAAAAHAPERLMAGAAVAAIDGDALRLVGATGDPSVLAPDGGPGMLRHVATRIGVGTAYVRDRAGADEVFRVTARDGVQGFPAGGEALHPALSARGDLVWAVGANLRLVRSGATRSRSIAGPVRGGLAFSPLFRGSSLVAAVSAAPTRAVPEDEDRSDLWGYRPLAHRWTRLTRLPAGSGRFSVVRTPIASPDGGIEFVRITGAAAADSAPRYELWRWTPAGARLERALPGEMYLAGSLNGGRLWNVRAGTTGGWQLATETADGGMRIVGCGAVMVDPLDRVDPDARPGDRLAPLLEPAAAASPTVGPSPIPTANAIIVGDFSTSAAAADAAAQIVATTGLRVQVTDGTQLPALVRPGVSAVEVLLPAGPDPEEQLAMFRSELPSFAGWSWLVAV